MTPAFGGQSGTRIGFQKSLNPSPHYQKTDNRNNYLVVRPIIYVYYCGNARSNVICVPRVSRNEIDRNNNQKASPENGALRG